MPLVWTTAYTGTTNLLDYTCAVLPVTKADKSIDTFDEIYIPMTEADRINWQDCKPFHALFLLHKTKVEND